MKIVYCINNTWYSGGMTRVLTNKANYLASQGHDVTIITTDQGEHIPHYPLDEKVKQLDLGINYLGLDQRRGIKKIFKTIRYLRKHKQKLKQALFRIHADVVISMFTREMFILPSIKDKSAKIIEIHTSKYNWLQLRDGRGMLGKIQNWMDLRAVKKFDHFVVLTQEDKAYWHEVKNISVIPNANTFIPLDFSRLDKKKVLAVGRHDYGKNFKDLITAWSIVTSKFPDWKLKIVGDGELRDSLRQQILEAGLENNVELIPNKREIQTEYIECSIFLFSSIYEGFGMVLLEAQSFGVPLVSYACKCGPSEIIVEGENGFLVDVYDTEALADRIMRLMGDDALRMEMGRKAKEHSKRFSEHVIMEKWLRLFQALQNNKSEIWH